MGRGAMNLKQTLSPFLVSPSSLVNFNVPSKQQLVETGQIDLKGVAQTQLVDKVCVIILFCSWLKEPWRIRHRPIRLMQIAADQVEGPVRSNGLPHVMTDQPRELLLFSSTSARFQ